jgi:hypothetical protein
MDMVHLPGKGIGARRVPLLLTSDMVASVNALAKHRTTCGIPESNIYCFAVPSNNGYVNGWQAMNNVAKAAKLEKPNLIHSTRLRKYIATVTQVMLRIFNGILKVNVKP